MYWNPSEKGVGRGWDPIEDFSAVFDGNGYTISNLFINRATSDNNGLFESISSAHIRNLGLIGDLMMVLGEDNTGSLAGAAHDSVIENVFNTGIVQGVNGVAGGIVGKLVLSKIKNSFNTGSVQIEEAQVGGLVGYLKESEISNSFSTGFIRGASKEGGLVGWGPKKMIIHNAYWAKDSSAQSDSWGSNADLNYVGISLAALQCATKASVTSIESKCISNEIKADERSAPFILFHDWQLVSKGGHKLWNFGNKNQLPALVLNKTTYRDSDGDGSLNTLDQWPADRFASIDVDRDRYPDKWTIGCDKACIADSGEILDQFPLIPEIGRDDDLDGLADEWSAKCGRSCQKNSAIILDTYLSDTDNDGINNLKDDDDNNDGKRDADADSDGLIDINNVEQLNAIRFQMDGSGRKMAKRAALDNSGCPVVLFQGRHEFHCHGYELTNDIDFDTNQDGRIDSHDKYWNSNTNNRGEGWNPIGKNGDETIQFSSVFNGNNYVIKNLYINRPSTHYIGLFGYLYDAEIKNLGLTGELMQVKGRDNTGAIAGFGKFTHIQNSFNTGSVQGHGSSTGGLVGSMYEGKMSYSFNTGSVHSIGNDTGGLFGSLYKGALESSYNTGAIQSDGRNTGGISGRISEAKVKGCLNAGYIRSKFLTEGIYGVENESEFSSCFILTDLMPITPLSNKQKASGFQRISLNDLTCSADSETNKSNNECDLDSADAKNLSETLLSLNQWGVSKIRQKGPIDFIYKPDYLKVAIKENVLFEDENEEFKDKVFRTIRSFMKAL